ncbi:MAG TPA: hypothetical protein VHM00_15860 [Caldimonas sp.]|jgi:hypothetical protein|nr:hypothetical protein [Caldimonas sp.]HEX2542546.1 hypothetical protein [Caldimonas sp.]
MNEPARPTSRKRSDGTTAVALAAGLLFGHVVAAMAAQAAAGPATVVAAFVFVTAACAGTVCALAQLTTSRGVALARHDLVRWVLALGAGVVGALSPGLF